MNDVKHRIDPNQREDLRNVFLAIFDSCITTTIPEVAAQLGLKRNYVKELFAVLETHADRDGVAFVVVNSEPGENGNEEPHAWYQTSHTVDNKDRDWMEHWFDEHFPTNAPAEPKIAAPRTPQNATNPADLPLCKCGCGEICNRGRNYRPGHDARHAGVVGRLIGELNPTQDDLDEQIGNFLGTLPTAPLQAKAEKLGTGILAKKILKAEALMKGAATEVKARLTTQEMKAKELIANQDAGPRKPAPIEKVEEVDGVVKVGRWVYEAKQNSKSGAVRYTKKHHPDVWHVATDRQAASFVAKEDGE